MTDLDFDLDLDASDEPRPALDAAIAVLAWARRGQGAPPRVALRSSDLGEGALLSPPASLTAAAGALAATRAARLGLRAPPLGDATSPGTGSLLIAAAVGLAHTPPVALTLLEACPRPACAWDLVLRDAIVAPALAASPDDDIADALRASSPLSSALERPPPGGDDEALTTIEELILHPDGRRAVVLAFSRPGAPLPVRRFREGAMDRLRTRDDAGRDVVLEIYEALLVHHRERAMAEITAARSVLSGREVPGLELGEALGIGAFWGPLWEIRRAYPDALRRRPYLDIDGLLQGTRLFQIAQRLSVDTP